jgi:23S rRNA pseudouridine1911/1915/1917 synthase
MEYIGHPVLGDPIYGRRGDKLPGQALHAARLGFTHPATGQYMEFASDPPADFQALLASLRVK